MRVSLGAGGFMGVDGKPRLGVGMMPIGISRRTMVETAVAAEGLGYELFSVGEGWTYDATVVLTEVAIRTERIRICSNILSVFGRTAATTAMSAATIQESAAGRYILGLGASTSALVEGLHDQRYSAPYSRLKHHLRYTRALLAGDRAPTDGSGERPLKLGLRADPTPIWVAGMGPRSRQLIGREADGWLPVLTPPSVLRRWREEMTKERKLPPLVLAPMVMVVVRESEDEARADAAAWLRMYATRMGEFYPAHMRSLGYGRAVDRLQESSWDWRAPDVQEAVQDLTVAATPDTARDRIDPWVGGGIDLPKIAIQPASDQDKIRMTLEALAPTD